MAPAKVKCTLNLPESIHQQLKVEAALRNCTMGELVEAALLKHPDVQEAVKIIRERRHHAD
jgi:hypothetical protein